MKLTFPTTWISVSKELLLLILLLS